MGTLNQTTIPHPDQVAGAAKTILLDGAAPPPPAPAPRPSPVPQTRPSPPGPPGTDFFALSDGVGRSAANRSQDVIKVESLLDEADVKKTDGPTGYFGLALEDRIKTYQTHRGLKPDGVIAPGGPTIRTLEDHLAPRVARRPVPTPQQIEAHHRALAEGRDSPLFPKPKPLALRPGHEVGTLDAGDAFHNGRTLDHLRGQRDDGDLPKFLADDVRLGSRGRAKVHDLLSRLETRDPARAAQLGHKIAERLSPEERAGLFAPERLAPTKSPRSARHLAAERVLDRASTRFAENTWSEGSDIPGPEALRRQEEAQRLSKEREEKLRKLTSQRKQAILSGGEADFSVSPNPEANPNKPIYSIESASEVKENEELIERKAKEGGVDPDLVRAVIYIETTQGWYDRLKFGSEDTIRPLNVHAEYWKDLGFDRKDLRTPEKNIEAGVKLLKEIQRKMPDASIEQIATIYNRLGATTVTDYGARVGKLYREKPWRKRSITSPNLPSEF